MLKRLNKYIDVFFQSKFSIYLIISLTMMIVLPNIGRESLWYDELYSAIASLQTTSVNEMFYEFILQDVHPPLYQLLLYYWGTIVNPSDFNLRLLSYIFVILSLSSSYFLLHKFFTYKVAILFIAMNAFTPGVLYYAQELRSYALLYGLSSVLSIIYVIFILKIKNNENIPKYLLFLYFSLGVLITYTHYFGYILIFSLSVCSLVYAIVKKNKNATLYIFITSILIACLAIFWLYIHINYGNIGGKTAGHFWIQSSFAITIKGFSIVFFGNIIGLIAYFIVLLMPHSNFFSTLHTFKKHILYIVPSFITILIAFLISLHTPILTGRNLIVIIPLILFYLTLFLNEKYERKKIFIAFFLITLLLTTAYKSFTYQKQNWRDGIEYINSNFDKRECVLPVRLPSDSSMNKPITEFMSYYLNSSSLLKFHNGPLVQKNCDLIYFDAIFSKKTVLNTLKKKGISVPFEILDFGKVHVVIKK